MDIKNTVLLDHDIMYNDNIYITTLILQIKLMTSCAMTKIFNHIHPANQITQCSNVSSGRYTESIWVPWIPNPEESSRHC